MVGVIMLGYSLLILMVHELDVSHETKATVKMLSIIYILLIKSIFIK